MLDVLAAPEALPFTVALGVMALLALLEIVGALVGLAPSHAVDSWFDHDVHPDLSHGEGFFGATLDWLSVGRVPLLVLIIAFLTSFGLTGLVIERLAFGLTGHFVPGALAAAGALVLALPLTRFLGNGLARILPREETDAVSVDGFIGKTATITQGEARRGLPAEAKLTDVHGKAHYLRVEPDADGATFPLGARVLIVERRGSVFRVIDATSTALSPT